MSGDEGGRVRFGGYLTPDAKAGWDEFYQINGVNATALLEAVGLALLEHPGQDINLAEHVAAARRIEAERLRRRRQMGVIEGEGESTA